jgi:small conductance mechanosensitive channel
MPIPAATGACHNGGDGTAIDDFCGFVSDHTGSQFLVALIGRVLWPLLVFAVLLVAARVVRRLVRRALRRSGADAQIGSLVRNVLIFAGYVVAFGGAFVAAGLDFSVFLTLGGATSIVLGLAFQDLLRNVLAGTFLLIERPFRIGDLVTIDTLTGTVRSIELRTTTLRLPDGKLAIIPNLDAFNKRVINLNAFDRRQFSVTVWVPLDLDLEAVLHAAGEALAAIPEIAPEPPARIQPDLAIDGGVTLNCQYWLDYRECDPDAIAAGLVRALAAAVEAVRSGPG